MKGKHTIIPVLNLTCYKNIWWSEDTKEEYFTTTYSVNSASIIFCAECHHSACRFLIEYLARMKKTFSCRHMDI